MAKNYMADVAKMLGVELEEEFKIDSSDTIFKFYENELWHQCGGMWLRTNSHLIDLIKGDSKIVKLPWQPKKGDKYYTPSTDFDRAICYCWKGYSSDFALKKVGMVFRTKEECEAALPELRKKYLGGDDNV